MQLFDCTLRDGGNVLGNGFTAELTTMMIQGLVENGIPYIEYGNANGIGAYEDLNKNKALTDEEYLALAAPWKDKAKLGMFMLASCATQERVEAAAKAGLSFLRVGANAGDGAKAVEAVKLVKKNGLVCCYSLMKAYVLSPDALADEASMLEEAGVDIITIMDSAGTMMPEDTALYVDRMTQKVNIPVGFHGHNNLGLSAANALAAAEHGADILDCGLLGMARSAGNMPTELAVALMHQQGKAMDVDLYTLLKFEDEELIPAMEKEGYHTPLKPKDLILGYSGAHSSFMGTFRSVAQDCGVDLYHLIVETSKLDRKAPTEALMRQVAARIKEMNA